MEVTERNLRIQKHKTAAKIMQNQHTQTLHTVNNSSFHFFESRVALLKWKLPFDFKMTQHYWNKRQQHTHTCMLGTPKQMTKVSLHISYSLNAQS